uniref:C2H2-type domain-containing protein n=1 Tax=Megaselia scalaris TaxID=36166 RepID=T1GC03_MEGSC
MVSKANSLQNHQLTVHSSEAKRFPCPFEGCQFVTDKAYSLKTHTWTHKEERDFPCTFEGCEYRGKTKAALWKQCTSLAQNQR